MANPSAGTTSMSHQPSTPPPSIPAATVSPEYFLFLDIDGVLNRLEPDPDDDEESKKKKKKKKKSHKHKSEAIDHSTSSSSDLVDHLPEAIDDSVVNEIQSVLEELQLADSFNAELLAHLLYLIRVWRELNSTTAADVRVDSHTSDESPSPSNSVIPGVQIVLTSTWRLQPESLKQITNLFQRLQLISTSKTNDLPSSTDSTLNPDGSSSSPSILSSALPSPASSQLHSLLLTPNLGGWGSRLEEITAFLQSHCSINKERRDVYFLILDDMDLFAGTKPMQLDESIAHLLNEYRSRTIRLDGLRGLDLVALGGTVRKLKEELKLMSNQFWSLIHEYQLPQPPS